MWLKDFYQRWRGRWAQARRARPPAPRSRPRLALEQLEDRTVPASFTAASVAELVADINAANLLGGANTINLSPGTTFTLTASYYPYAIGAGLPGILANDNLTIIGNGDTIERSAAVGTPDFRLFGVAPGASLALTDLTLQGGVGVGGGGAVFNAGTLTLDGVTVQNNTARGARGYDPPADGNGGGIWSSGTLTLTGNT